MKYENNISVIIPTLNSEMYLEKCLTSIIKQKNLNKIEIIVADGGSNDETINIAKKFNVKIYNNLLKTAEAGKAIGIKKSNYQIIALVDSDNIIDDDLYFFKSIQIFNNHNKVDCIEPLKFKFLKYDSDINKYCSLMGLNDPIEYYIGRFDKYNVIINDYTLINKKNIFTNKEYLLDRYDYGNTELLPTFGANGTILKKTDLQSILNFDELNYYFDNDIIYKIFKKKKTLHICKIKNEIIHDYCQNDHIFIKKQLRRITDYLFFSNRKKNIREKIKISNLKYLKLFFLIILIIPILLDSIMLYFKSNKKISVFSHFYYTYLTAFIYGFNFFKFLILRKSRNLDRTNW